MLIVAAGVPFAVAAEPVVGGIVQPSIGVDIPGGDGDYALEDEVTVDTWARGFAKGELASGDRWFVEGRLQHHLLYGPAQADGLATEGWWAAGLGDSGWDGKLGGPVSMRIGTLVERWGTLELLPVSDVLNPRDGRSGPLTPPEFLKLPLPMAIVRVGNDTVTAETLLIPFSGADKLWIRDQDWSFVRQGMLEDEVYRARQGWGWQGEGLTFLDNISASLVSTTPANRRLTDAAIGDRSLPEGFVGNGEIAERFRLHASNLDLDLMGGYLRARQPEASLAESLQGILTPPHPEPENVLDVTAGLAKTGPLEVTWPRTGVVGLDGATLVGPVQIRLDSLYQTARPVRTWYAGGESVPQLAAGIGFDYVRGSTFFASLESRWQHLVDPPEHMLMTREDQVQVAGGLRLGLLRGALTVQLGGMYDLSFREYVARPSVGFRFTDHVQADLTVLLLGGATPPPANLDEVLVYEGGPASFFSQNDTVQLSVSLIR